MLRLGHTTASAGGTVMKAVEALFLFFLLTLLTAAPSHASASTPASPPVDSSSPQKIYVAVGVLDIDGIDSAAQSFTVNLFVQFRWHDPRLAHDGDSDIRTQLTDIHAPRFLLLNRQKTWSSLLNVVDISPAGEALYRMRLWGNFSQIMRLQEFPMDGHTFEIPIVAIGYTGEPVTLLQDPLEHSSIAREFSVADWYITSWEAEAKSVQISEHKAMNGFVYSFYGERISAHYFIKLIIPLFLIVAMSWVVFWIDPSHGSSQLGVAVTAVLTLIAYHIALTSKLPDISYLTRMDLFLFGSTLLVFSSLIEVVVTSRLADAGRLNFARHIDIVCRILFPLAYLLTAYLALVSRMGASM
jgi:hypothetical protein